MASTKKSAKKETRRDAPAPVGASKTKAGADKASADKASAPEKPAAADAGKGEAKSSNAAPQKPEQGDAMLPSGAILASAESQEEHDLAVYTSFAGKFWKGTARRKAWLLTGGVATFIVFNLAVQIGINRWNAYFFNALEQKDVATATTAILMFVALTLMAAAVAVGMVQFRMRLQVAWRQWLTGELSSRWLAEQRFYRLSISAPEVDAPEFRMAEDARIATEPVVDFVIGIANAGLLAIAFLGVLWGVGGSITISGYTIPGYMVFASILYAVFMSGCMAKLGMPLVQKVERKNEAEARLRFELGRVRENAEQIALIGGEKDEKSSLGGTLRFLVNRWLEVVKQQARMTWFINGNAVLAPVFPLLIAAPKYLSGEMTLGSLMQTSAAFVQVQLALNWLVENYVRVAEWLASVSRVVGLWGALSDLDQSVGETPDERIVVDKSPDDAIHLSGVWIGQHDGRIVIEDADAKITSGERVLLTGESGTGKSTLVRAIAGLWPWGSGKILVPADAEIAFLPQRPYIPLGTLRNAITYSTKKKRVSDQAIKDAMRRCGLRHLLPRLDEEERWDKVLSGGEQQRLAFTRLVVLKPDIVIMDEATSALDEDSQASMMELFRHELKGVTLISVGHRPGLEEFHERKLTLQRHPGHARARAPASEGRGARLLSRLLRRSLRPRPSVDPGHAD
jgi:vitamin B12/bleomycin/antimicrobial peptide transport system ATP-binding/permease protein